MITVKNVSKDYYTGGTVVHALKNVSFLIAEGDFLSIAGPSGSGKTTLLNILGCIDSFDAGTYTFEGEEITGKTRNELARFRRENLGFIFQTFNLIPVLTAFENVSFALSLLQVSDAELKRRTMAILDEVGLNGMEHRRPTELSGGQQQRVAIARALVKAPKIVLADEPTANLDSSNGKAILELMRTLNEKYHTTYLFSTHDPMVMEFASRLISLHDGEIVEDRRRN